MADTTLSPNMNLPVPNVSVAPGPDWATDINACMSGIDSHTHVSGQGVAITPSGLNINSDLPINGNNVTTARSVRFSPQNSALAGASDLGCLYEVTDDLYYNDGAGNQIRITQGGTVTGATGTITGLPSGTASASFAAGTFTFQSATNTPATMNIGPIVTGAASASSKKVTIAAQVAQPSDYDLFLPLALPVGNSFVNCDSSGNIGFTGITGSGGSVVLSSSPTISSPTINNGTITNVNLVASTISNPTFAGTPSGVITSGSYTPTVASGGSGSGQIGIAGSFSYTRIGDQVTVYGRISGATTSGGAATFTISLPINPTNNFSDENNLIGLASVFGGNVFTDAYVKAKTSAKLALASFQDSPGATSTVNAMISFTYSCA